VEAAASRIKMVNSAVNLVTYHCRGDRTNLPEIFAGCNLVIDCLDNLHSRFDLEKACIKLNVPLVHGAIAGFLGQVAVIRPDKPLLASIYGSESDRSSDRGVERELGNPATTPSMIASWQVIEAVKYLARLDGVLPSGKMLIIDMYSGESYQLELSG
jgi:molybdopterin/thiamine biosynthesis adenylyltransferase